MAWIYLSAGGIGLTYLLSWAWLLLSHDAKEPQLVASSIPFLTPIFEIIRHSMGFYGYLRDKHPNLPIYTLRIPGVKIYVVNSAALIPVVQKQWRTLIFAPVQARAAEMAMGGSKESLQILCDEMTTEEGFVPKFARKIYPTLSGGRALDDLSQKSMEVILQTLDRFAVQGPTIINLNEFISEQIFYATTDAIYGARNPMRDPGNYAAWKDYHPSIMFLMLDVLPQAFFKSSIQSRERLVQSFRRYDSEKGYDTGSDFIRCWMDHFRGFGLSEADIARFHVGGLFALVANTAPSAFWMAYRVFSDPVVLADCRAEVSRAVSEDEDGVCTISSSVVKTSCPVLVSTFQEVFRIHGSNNSIRVASEDHMLDDKYLIKKDGLIMIPGRVQHTDRNVWGKDWSEFDRNRFTRKPNAKRPSPVAFRGFGGGTTLCPGRHLATAEILLFSALLIMRFDMRPFLGEWELPSTDQSSQAEAIEQPDHDIEIKLIPRPGADRVWRIASSAGSIEPQLTAEDGNGNSH